MVEAQRRLCLCSGGSVCLANLGGSMSAQQRLMASGGSLPILDHPFLVRSHPNCFIPHKNQDLKKAVLYGGGLITAQRRHGLHSVGFVCIEEARSAQRIWEARCLHNRGSWRAGVPSLLLYLMSCKSRKPWSVRKGTVVNTTRNGVTFNPEYQEYSTHLKF